jgi:prepilin-type N-terminal cleavage/methylation domain-containing protein/prepilin-type processing-associated H-X9-DG protein
MRHSRRNSAFTLIELLVVIAIIAILAAILFPVFAQAREKARQASCLSNQKQLALGVLQYVQDYDETFPYGLNKNMPGGWASDALWTVAIQPYIKSVQVFACPSDGRGMEPNPNGPDWMGLGISYAANGYYNEWCCSPDWNSGFKIKGLFGMAGEGWLMSQPKALADVNRSADTIMIAEKWNSDSTYKVGWLALEGGRVGNMSGFSPNVMIGDVFPSDWGDQRAPDGTRTEAAYPNGKNGAVSAHRSGFANFAFADGHVKAFKPAATNPDPVNKPDQNMWDSTRK